MVGKEKKKIFYDNLFGRYKKNVYLCNTRTPKPLYNAQIGGRFFTYTTMTETYPKKYNSPDDLVALLIQRGLTITDESIASQYIRNIGYYRLSAYLYPLLDIPKEKQIFKQNSCFGKALELYCFDKKLRLFLFNEIEKIEISFRSSLANIVSEETGNIFWITDSTMFANSSTFYDICILKWFVNVISPENDMKRHLKKLLSDFPSVDVTAMGFPKNWEEEPLWCSAPQE
mgnify:CR=1 FL=1